MNDIAYEQRRGEIETYFDRTAADAWARLTSSAPGSGIRATVRAGRDLTRSTLLGWLPENLHGRRILDAGCCNGALAVGAERRGAQVVAIDLSPTLVQHAQERAEAQGIDDIDFRAGDMLDPSLGHFDYVVAMDSIIHYELQDMVKALATLAPRVNERMVITVAPRTPMLSVMRAVGKLFPRSDRSPSIVPVSENAFRKALADQPALESWGMVGTRLVESGFYRSMAINLQHATLGAHGARRG